MSKEKLYLAHLKQKYNQENSHYIFDESQTGPQEEPCLLAYKMDVNKFNKYLKKKKEKRGK